MSKSRHSIRSTELRRDLFSQKAIEEWAEGLIKAWVVKMDELGMLGRKNQRGLLVRSLMYTIIWESRGGDAFEFLQRVVFAFNAYGRFVDYGLGRGTDLKDRFGGGRDAANNSRKRKEWIQEPWIESLKVLRPIVRLEMKRYTTAMMRAHIESFNTVETHFKTRDI